MANFATTFKQEISRLARREMRGQIAALRKSSAQHRREIAALKREAAKLKSALAKVAKSSGKKAAPEEETDGSPQHRFSAKSVMSQRRRLALSAADYGKLVGVTAATIYAWERGGSRPRRAQLATLASLRALGKVEARARLQGPAQKPARKKKAKT
jgi:DNA-binding transcriptional regulator YiaG